ncbi:MAG: hypothetical protein IT378_08780 [Sandaracinaceae bacterium]|nr:hypothetical protein [Sandaracinaceae bacterium]
MSRARVISLLAMLAVAAAGAYVLSTLEVTSDITHFLPAGEDAELASLIGELSRSDLNRTITLTIEAPDRDASARAAALLASKLSIRPEVAAARSGPDPALERAFYEVYFPRRLLLLSDHPEDLQSDLLSDVGLRRSAHELRQRLASPAGGLVRRVAPEDPLLSFPRWLERLREAEQGGLEVHEGALVTADGRFGVVLVESASSPFDTERERRLQDGIARDFAAVERELGVPLRLEQSGVGRFALRTEASVSEDITRISVVSTLGVLALFLAVFRSPRYLLMSFVVLGAGFVAGLTAVVLAFDTLHGLTLAFGSSLIGVGTDFVVHYVNHHVLKADPDDPRHSLHAILPGLALAAGTTIVGLAGLAWTSFPGLRELALFSSVGTLGSLVATVWLLPPWMPAKPEPTRLHRWLEARLTSALHRLRWSRAVLIALPVIALAVCAAGLARLEWVDDIRQLNALDPELVREDERVRERVSRVDAGRFVVALGPSEEVALQRNDAVALRLQDMLQHGELARVRSLHGLLWSARLQRESLAAVRASPSLAARTLAALEQEGFVASAFAPFEASVEAEPEPLPFAALEATPLGALARPFRASLRGEDGERVAILTLLRGGDTAAIEARLRGLEGVRVVDQGSILTQAYGRFRARTLELVGLGLIAVFVMILVRYRKLSLTLAAFAPAILASATSVAIVALLGQPANLMHLVAILLVLSMGEDYGVFMVESRKEAEGTAVVGLIIACLTTVLSFGLLAMSQNPALRALGAVTGLGVLLSLVLAPVGWLLSGARKE